MRRLAAFLALLLLVVTAGDSVAQQWVDFTSKEIGFTAQFPETPTTKVEQAKAGNVSYTEHWFSVDHGEQAYIIVMFDYPSGTLPRNPSTNYLSDRIKDFAKGSGTVVRSQYPVTIAGRPGMEAITDDDAQNIHYLLDILVVGNRMFALLSGGGKGHETSDDAIRFRNAFRLTN